MTETPEGQLPGEPPLDSTALLLQRIRAGDDGAREELFARCLPVLRRWAHRRLPGHARDLSETDDLVQVTLMRALKHLDRFEPRREGAFLAYLRTILLNTMRNEIRRVVKGPQRTELQDDHGALVPSELERRIGRERLERYERALAELPDTAREAIILRVEFGFSHEQIASALGKPSADAARVTVSRAMLRLAELMDDGTREA